MESSGSPSEKCTTCLPALSAKPSLPAWELQISSGTFSGSQGRRLCSSIPTTRPEASRLQPCHRNGQWADPYFEIAKRHDEFGHINRTEIAIQLRAKTTSRPTTPVTGTYSSEQWLRSFRIVHSGRCLCWDSHWTWNRHSSGRNGRSGNRTTTPSCRRDDRRGILPVDVGAARPAGAALPAGPQTGSREAPGARSGSPRRPRRAAPPK